MIGRTVKAALTTLALVAAPLAAADRPYDAAVDKMIDTAYRGLDKFGDEMSSKAKGAKVTREGVETDISDFMKDFKSDGKLLKERFGANDMAAGNALNFLRKGKATDGFIERHPGFTGADSEWTYLRPVLVDLAGAYNIDWATDPATWKAVRSSDKTGSGMLAGLDKQVKAVGSAATKAGKAAKVDKAALKSLDGSVAALRGSAKSLTDAFKQKLPTGSAADGFFAAVETLQSGIAGLGLSDATASAMSPLSTSVKSLATALGR